MDENRRVTTLTEDWGELSKKRNLKSSKRHMKKGVKVLIIILLILVVLMGALFAYFKFFKADSMDIYTGIVKDSMSLAEKTASESFRKTGASYKEDGNISISTDMSDLKSLNGSSLSYVVDLNAESNKLLADIIYKESNKDIFKGVFYVKDKKLYINSKQIYDKPVFIELDDELSVPTDVSSLDNSKDIEYLLDKTSLYLQKAISKANYETRYGKKSIDGKTYLVQKNIMVINAKNVEEIKTSFLGNIESDSKFIDLLAKLSESSKDSIKDELKELSSSNVDLDNEITFEIDTCLLSNKFISGFVKEDKDIVMKVDIQKDKSYKIIVFDEGKISFEGTLIVSKNEISFETEIEGYKLNLNVEQNGKNNSKLVVKVTDKNGKYFNLDIDSNVNSNKEIKEFSIKGAVDMINSNDSQMETIGNNINKIMESSKIFSYFLD